MEFKIIQHLYENTGGGCMVGFAQVWLPEENRTIFTNCNDEGCSFFAVDAYHGDVDIDPFDSVMFMDNSDEYHKYFEVARECLRRFLLRDGHNHLPFIWLPDEVRQQVTGDYTDWLIDTYGVDDPCYETDGAKLYLDEEYACILSEHNRKIAAEKAAAVCAVSEKMAIVHSFLNFKDAYLALLEKWEKYPEVSDILVTQYPFDASFDELPIAPWCDDVVLALIEQAI